MRYCKSLERCPVYLWAYTNSRREMPRCASSSLERVQFENDLRQYYNSPTPSASDTTPVEGMPLFQNALVLSTNSF
jgi:hypothetical protein